ncbi:MAG: glycosyltransferase [bacterium]
MKNKNIKSVQESPSLDAPGYVREQFAQTVVKKKGNRLAVVYISHSAFVEGAEKAMLNTTDVLLNRGAYVHVVLPFKGPLEKCLQDKGVDYSFLENRFSVVTEGESKAETKDKIYENSLELSELLKLIAPDVVVTTTSVIQEGALAAKLLGIPHVWNISEYGRKEHGIKYLMSDKERFGFIDNHSDKIIFPSEALRKYYGKNIDQKKAFVFPPISAKEILDVSTSYSASGYYQGKNALKLALAGNIHRGKGQVDATLAIAELVKEGITNIELTIVGPVSNKDYLGEIQQIIKTKKIEKYINILPPVDNVKSLFMSSDVVLMCSVYEAFGRVTAEAMLCKKPVIGANSGGTPELILENKSGYLYEPGDYHDLAEKIRYFVLKPQDISEFGGQGYTYINKVLDDKANADRYYAELVALRGKKKKNIRILRNIWSKIVEIPTKDLPARITRSIYWRTRRPLEWSLNKLLLNPVRDTLWKIREHEGLQYLRWRRINEISVYEQIKENIKISVIVPVYNVEPNYLDKCIQSVVDQVYSNWELCLYDDCSTRQETKDCLKDWAKKDKRIKVSFGKKNQHISGASNEAINMTTGDYIGLLDNDDEISPNALYEAARAIQENPELKYIYSDEDKIDERGSRFAPFFKPDWTPDLLLSMMYTSHFSVYKKSVLAKVGGFRLGYEGSQDYDLALRVTEKLKPNEIHHIPKVLYHWRAVAGSTAQGHSEKDYASVAAKKSLADYMKRNSLQGSVVDGIAPGSYRVKREIVPRAKVSIIIPFRDQVDFLKVCVDSIISRTNYDNYEILLVNNDSSEEKTKKYLQNIKTNEKIKLLDYTKPFNFSAINNFAAKVAKGEHLLFLNNDTEVISAEWLSAMLEQSQRREVGAVGAKLLYSDNRIQHAGVIMGMGVAGHAHKFVKDSGYGYFSQAVVIRDYAAVTAACLMIKKPLFLELGGFNEKDLTVAYNDVDLCLRAHEKGYLNVYTPYAKLYHYESASRGYEHPDELANKDPERHKRVMSEIDYMEKNWKDLISDDPYFSPNLSRTREDYQIKVSK